MDINKLLKIGKLKKFRTEDLVFSENQDGDEMYIVLQGRVGIYSYNIDGSRVQLAELKSGEFFGEMALVDQQKRSADVQAIDDITLFVITSDNFEQVVAMFPDLAIKIMKGMSLRIRKLNTSYKKILKTAKSLEPHRSVAEISSSNKGSNELSSSKENEPEQINAKDVELLKNSNESSEQTDKYEQSTGADKKGVDYEQIFVSDSYKHYLIKSTVHCPVCENSFETDRIRNTLLKQSGEDRDFRIRYPDFEPYWYKIWVCPHCYYGNFEHDFKEIHYLKKKTILSKKNEWRSKYLIKWGQRKNLQQVITELLLSQEIHGLQPKERLPYAKIWLYLSWLYEDAEDSERFEFSNQKAVEAYLDFYNNEMIDLERGQEIRLCILIAELYKKQYHYEKATRFLLKAVQMKTEPKRLREIATDRLMEYKKLSASKKEE